MKRFTETTKWEDPWFRKLKPKFKAFFIYVCDSCDCAGVWKVDFELASIYVGEKINRDEALSAMSGRLLELRDDKWWIPKFIAFQCGRLSRDCKPHMAIFKALQEHGISVEEVIDKRLSKGYPKGINTLQEKEKEKEQDKKRKGECEGDSPAEPTVDRATEIYQQYPRHLNRTEALKAIEKAMKTADPDYLLARTSEFARRTKGCDTQFVPYPASWFNAGGYDSDPAEWDKIGRKNGHHTQVPIDYSKGF